MLGKIAVAMVVLLLALACGEVSPAQQTEDAYREQTKEWEKARDKAQDGWNEEELISGEHCKKADDDIHPTFQIAELVKAEIEHPETFEARLGKIACSTTSSCIR